MLVVSAAPALSAYEKTMMEKTMKHRLPPELRY
jgi:hypothetical protein